MTDSNLAWQTTYVDLLIRAPPKSSGSLIRLLKSIEDADYFGYRRPHITIELPADVDLPTFNYIENMIWPPLDWSGSPHASQLTVRHRIPKRSFTAEEASSYFVESFYPTRPHDSHVLVLSPQVELSTLYYHYLMYNLLELRYSRSSDIDYLMGISLELPSTYLNGSASFDPPVATGDLKDPVAFLWEAPNCNAALYFGERWMEFHSFLANRVSTMKTATPSLKKQITENYPAWVEYLLELMRARGYLMFYPNYESMISNAFITVHSELNQPPEEYNKKAKSENDESPPPLDPDDPLEADSSTHAKTKPQPPEPPLLKSTLLSLLPSFEDMPSLSSLPHMSYDGQLISASSRLKSTEEFAKTFRLKIGGCDLQDGKVTEAPRFGERSADDLFCNLNDPPELPAQMNADPHSTAPQTTWSPDYDENAISADSAAQAQNEFSAHLRRQSGEKESKGKKPRNGAPAAIEDDNSIFSSHWDPKIEEDKQDIIPAKAREEAKTEFEKHLARQGDQKVEKPAQNPQKSEEKKPTSKSEKQGTSADDSRENSIDAGTVPATGAEQRDPGW